MLVTGATGLLGNYFVEASLNRYEVVGISRKTAFRPPCSSNRHLDLTNSASTLLLLNKLRPEVIVNSAALTNVEQCEAEPARAWAMNVEAAKRLASWSAENRAKLVQISTDSVFDGTRGNYRESDEPCPLNVYARTKFAAEKTVQSCCPDALTIRTNFFGWSQQGASLAEWMLAKLIRSEPFCAFTDVSFSPLFAKQLAEFTLELILRNACGVFHVAARESCSKHELAVLLARAFHLNETLIKPIRVDEFPFRARRSRDTSLSVEKIVAHFGHEMPTVKEQVEAMRQALPLSNHLEDAPHEVARWSLSMARILYVTQGYCSHDRRFLTRLAEMEHEIYFQPCEATSVQSDLPRVNGSIRWQPPLSGEKLSPATSAWLTAALRFRRLLRELNPDLVHAGPVQSGGFFAALSRFHPFLVMSWGSDVLSVPEQSAALKQITCFVLRHADAAIADCHSVRQRIAQLGEMPSNRIVTLPWGVQLDTFRPRVSTLQLRRQLGLTNYKVVITVRDFEPIHATPLLLAALKIILQQSPEIRVLMLGDGSLRSSVEVFIQANHLQSKINLAGRVPERMLPDYFAEANLYVSATPCDGSSISMLEAMACGLPVVVPENEGNREWVTDGENGWLFSAGDPKALANKILRALEDDSARDVAGRANVQIARERADWERNFTKVAGLYDKLLVNRNIRRPCHARLQNR